MEKKRIFISMPMSSVLKILFIHLKLILLNLNIEDKEYKVVLKDMQFHPVSDKILHADFIEIFDDKPVIINIPIKVTGDSVGVIAGGKLSIKKRNLKVKGLPKDLPEYLPIDITNLKIHEGGKSW